MANKVSQFLSDVTLELKKVSWSSRSEIIGSTVVVIVSVGVLALFIGMCDIVLSRLVTVIMATF